MIEDVLGEIKKQMLTLMTAAFGFVAALVWKDAISAWLAPLYTGADDAVGLTVAAAVVTVMETAPKRAVRIKRKDTVWRRNVLTSKHRRHEC